MAIALGAAGETFAASAEKFFEPPKKSLPALDPAGIYPHGQKIGFGMYSIVGNSRVDPQLSNMRRAADAGFTLAGPYFETNWRDFSPIYAAAGEGLKFTYQIRPPTSLVGVPVSGGQPQ